MKALKLKRKLADVQQERKALEHLSETKRLICETESQVLQLKKDLKKCASKQHKKQSPTILSWFTSGSEGEPNKRGTQ